MQNSLTSNRLTVSASLATLTFLIMAATVVHAQSPDFAFATTPSNLCVNPGVNAVAVVTVSSVGGFAGTINLASNVDPSVSNGPTLAPTPSTVTLVAGQSSSFNLALSTSSSTPIGTYTITVSGLSGATFHQTSATLAVATGCSVGGVVGHALATSYMGFGLVVAGLVGLVGATVAVRGHGRKQIPDF